MYRNFNLEYIVLREDVFGEYTEVINEHFYTSKEARKRFKEIKEIYGSDLEQVWLIRFRNNCTVVSEKLLYGI